MAMMVSKCKMLCTGNNLIIPRGSRDAVSYHAIKNITNSRNMRNVKYCTVIRALSSFEKHKKSLDSYIGKIHRDTSFLPVKLVNQIEESGVTNEQDEIDDRFMALENRIDKAEVESQSEMYVNEDFILPPEESDGNYLETGSRNQRSLKSYLEYRADGDDFKQISDDEAFNFYWIGVLASINIAVFLFEIASPVKISNLGLVSLPKVYGAKINNLIMTGEWWRLVTPMFLNAGILHTLLGSWILFTFGPQVSAEYGSFTFLLIYVLGGISGNLISFLHIPDPTVGGTGPAFAVIGAWLIYQVQNKDIIPRDASDKLYMKAIIATCLSFIISSFGLIDDWAHFASAFTGIAYGFLTCPTFQVKDASSSSSGEAGREERMTLLRRYADPCKSLVCFAVFLLLMSSLVFIFEPPMYVE